MVYHSISPLSKIVRDGVGVRPNRPTPINCPACYCYEYCHYFLEDGDDDSSSSQNDSHPRILAAIQSSMTRPTEERILVRPMGTFGIHAAKRHVKATKRSKVVVVVAAAVVVVDNILVLDSAVESSNLFDYRNHVVAVVADTKFGMDARRAYEKWRTSWRQNLVKVRSRW